jgi:hypothetical protein
MAIVGLLIALLSAVLLFWSIVKNLAVSDALADSYPTEFREEPMWRMAFPIVVFSPLTPLNLQLGCLQSLTGSCCATLGISLSCFSFGGVRAGCITLTMAAGFSALLVGYWKTYFANRRRKAMLSSTRAARNGIGP